MALETSVHHCAVFRDNDPAKTVEYALPIEDAVFRAGEAMGQTVRSFQTCAKGYSNMPCGSNSYDHRYKGMASRIRASHGKITEEAALQITRDVAMHNVNLHSVLCNCTDMRLWAARAKGAEDAWKQEYVACDLRELFKKPEERTPWQPHRHREPSRSRRACVPHAGFFSTYAYGVWPCCLNMSASITIAPSGGVYSKRAGSSFGPIL